MAAPGSWTGTSVLVAQAVRRDRRMLAVWAVLLSVTVYASAAATESLYPSLSDRVLAARAINGSPAIVALYGPILDERSLGELAMTKLTVLYAVMVALLAVVVVRRHTRTEEESGRAELLGGTAVGRDAPLAAAVLVSAGAVVVIGALAALADVLGGLPVGGSVAFGASWTGIGLVATGVSALACQVSASARTCAAIAAAAIGGLFVVRAVGDTSVPWLGWASPLGWSTRLRAWTDPRWWVLLLDVGAAVGLVLLAQALRGRRDLASGLVAPRPGPATGSPRLAEAVGLSVRLHTPMLVGWTVSTAAFALVMGSIAPNLGGMLQSGAPRAMIERIGGRGVLEDTLIAAVLSMSAVVVTCFAIAVVGHGGVDEREGRTEQVLATATSRTRTLLATVTVAFIGSAWLMLVTGLGVALGHGGTGGDLGTTFARDLPAALVQVPAVWLVAAMAVSAYALGRGTALGWGLLVAFLTVGQLGELLRLPSWVSELSPYVHVPRMPVEPFDPAPVVIMVLLSVVLLAAGAWRFRTRDIG